MSDFAYTRLLKEISEGQARYEANEEAKKSGATKYWYYIIEDYCPVCGVTDVTRQRMYSERPEAWEDRHRFMEFYDWCEG